MLQKYSENFESRNYIEGNFKLHNNCIWIVYPAGASGDLISSIVNAHYINTGSDFFGISSSGQVKFRPSDYKISNLANRRYKNDIDGLSQYFNNQFTYDLAESLSQRNLVYSLLDNIIFSNHLYTNELVQMISNIFSNSKIIRILPKNNYEKQIIMQLSKLKNEGMDIKNIIVNVDEQRLTYTQPVSNSLDIYWGDLFNENMFETLYSRIIDFLGLNRKLIRYDYIEYYVSMQTNIVQQYIKELHNG